MRIIAGPCQHESLEQSMKIARECKRVCDKHKVEYIFKASFDKANRSSDNPKRGLGIDKTLQDFRKIKETFTRLPMLTDVHEKEHINIIQTVYFDVIDILQIPAFLCRQTDLVKHAAATKKIINIKKGQFLAPWDMKGILEKCSGASEVWITERGTTFGYNTLVVDFTGLEYMLRNFNNVVFDVTHAVQKPGGLGGSSGGNRNYVPGLARAGSALGIQNFFMEVHEDPDNAPSDGPNMIPLKTLDKVVGDIVKYNYENRNTNTS